MSLLKNMKSEGLETQEDRLGGFSRKETNVYPLDIKIAYITESKNGALGLNLIGTINGQEYREPVIWFTNRDKENFYKDKDSGKKKPLPGFVTVNNLCRLAVDKELFELDTEDKTVKIYDPEEKKEVPKSVPCITELHGSKVLVAVVEQTVNKSEEDGKGGYRDIADSRDENFIEHVFHAEYEATVNELTKMGEAKAEGKDIPEPTFLKMWVEKYAGKKRDKRTIKDGESAPKSGRPSASNGGSAPQSTEKKTSSLFNRDK